MPEPPKRTINVKEILKDIQSGVDESRIKRKFRLSDSGYQSVIQKLTAMGLLKESDTHSRLSSLEQPSERPEPDLPPLPDQRTRGSRQDHKSEPVHREMAIVWRCPACGMPQNRAYEECPHCGVIVAKAAAMSQQGFRDPPPSAYRVESGSSALPSRWPIIVLSVLAVVVVGGLLLKWSSQSKLKKSIGISTTASAGVRTFASSNFDADVKDASKTMPVLVMFDADW